MTTDLSVLDERDQEYLRDVVIAATVEGNSQVRHVLVAAIRTLNGLLPQLCDDGSEPNAVEKKHGRDLVESLIESIELDLPFDPADLVNASDPEDHLYDHELAVEVTAKAIRSNLKGLRYV